MLSRVLWLKILKRYKRILSMDANTSLTSNIRNGFFIGLGIGTGIAISAYIAKKFHQQSDSRELVLALNQVKNEIKELRVSMVHHFERTASAFSNEQALTSAKVRYRRGDIQHEVLSKQSEALQDEESSSDDDFFDLLDDETEQEQSYENERYINLFLLNYIEIRLLQFKGQMLIGN